MAYLLNWLVTQAKAQPFPCSPAQACRIFVGDRAKMASPQLYIRKVHSKEAIDARAACSLPTGKGAHLYRCGNYLCPTSADSQDREELCRSEATVPSQRPTRSSMTPGGHCPPSVPALPCPARKGQSRTSIKPFKQQSSKPADRWTLEEARSHERAHPQTPDPQQRF